MKYFSKHIITITTLLFLLCSCEERIIWTLEENIPGRIVVDAIITNEPKSHIITVSAVNPGPNEEQKGISDVNIIIADEDGNVYTTSERDESPGLYETVPFQAVAGKYYALFLEYHGFIDTAFATMEGITPLKDLVIERADSGLLKIVPPESDGPAMTEVYYDWSDNAEYCQKYGNCYAAEVYYKINYLDIIREFAPEKQEILFPEETTIVRRKYSLSQEHQKFIRSLLIETEWRGGLFDADYGNVESNFRNGSFGFFGVCMVLSDTVTY